MKRAFFALAGTALTLAAVDLAHKARTEAAYVHPRATGYVVVVVALASIWAGALVATRSASLAAAGGVLAGGALGNLLSLGFWPGIPNPIELEPVAFNLADVFVLSGFVLTACATLAFARQNRERLGEPIRLR